MESNFGYTKRTFKEEQVDFAVELALYQVYHERKSSELYLLAIHVERDLKGINQHCTKRREQGIFAQLFVGTVLIRKTIIICGMAGKTKE